MNYLKRIPLQLSGLMLAIFSLGNLLGVWFGAVRPICGIIAFALMALLIARFIALPHKLAEELNNPVLGAVGATFPMALMVASTYVAPFAYSIAEGIWWLGLGLNIAIIIFYSVKVFFPVKLDKFTTAMLITYMGIIVSAITSPVYGNQAVGKTIVWIDLPILVALMIPVTLRYFKRPTPEPMKPLIGIYAGPASIIAAGYISTVPIVSQSIAFLSVVTIFGIGLYVFTLIKVIGCLKLPFYPSYVAWTFPFVLSATAMTLTQEAFLALGVYSAWMTPIVLGETVIATLLVTYVFIRFMKHIFFEG